jgi:hypothetical protein
MLNELSIIDHNIDQRKRGAPRKNEEYGPGASLVSKSLIFSKIPHFVRANTVVLPKHDLEIAILGPEETIAPAALKVAGVAALRLRRAMLVRGERVVCVSEKELLRAAAERRVMAYLQETLPGDFIGLAKEEEVSEEWKEDISQEVQTWLLS